MGKYGTISCQAINKGKTNLFFTINTRSEVRQEIQTMLGAQVLFDCEQYLGYLWLLENPRSTLLKVLGRKYQRE